MKKVQLLYKLNFFIFSLPNAQGSQLRRRLVVQISVGLLFYFLLFDEYYYYFVLRFVSTVSFIRVLFIALIINRCCLMTVRILLQLWSCISISPEFWAEIDSTTGGGGGRRVTELIYYCLRLLKVCFPFSLINNFFIYFLIFLFCYFTVSNSYEYVFFCFYIFWRILYILFINTVSVLRNHFLNITNSKDNWNSAYYNWTLLWKKCPTGDKIIWQSMLTNMFFPFLSTGYSIFMSFNHFFYSIASNM